ncbi:hypothetical protein [Elizabethkingia meningoseptica]|uniref:hypothetical protein n=1 Tax=Elizabethkingia meningoseptica TaxID=238 RepID=UPI003891BC47
MKNKEEEKLFPAIGHKKRKYISPQLTSVLLIEMENSIAASSVTLRPGNLVKTDWENIDSQTEDIYLP